MTLSAGINGYVTAPARRDINRAVACWLLSVAGLVIVMMVIGALTRLTGSGLSMVEWKPLTGILPPLNDAQWAAEFARYQASPEFRHVNAWMGVEDFKGIFWLEFIHRIWGRVIGLAFAVPMLFFLIRGGVSLALKARLVGLFMLGGAQGVMGWVMVQSGLVDNPAVSQYRLAAHLMLAMLILACLVWVAQGLLQPRTAPRAHGNATMWGLALLTLITVTIASGAFVAGLDAGLMYNTFPLMDGGLVPGGLWGYDPVWKAGFEDHTTVQWDHRWLAKLTVAAIIGYWLMTRCRGMPGRVQRAALILVGLGTLQAGLGIITLLSMVWIPVAALHQLGGALVLVGAVNLLHQLNVPAR